MITGIIKAIEVLEKMHSEASLVIDMFPTTDNKYPRGYLDGIKMAITHLDEYAKELNEEADNGTATS